MNKTQFSFIFMIIIGIIYYAYRIEPNKVYLNNHYVTENEISDSVFFMPLYNFEELLELAPHLKEEINSLNLSSKDFEKYSIWYGRIVYENGPYFSYGLRPYELIRVTNRSLIFREVESKIFKGTEKSSYHISEYIFRTSSRTSSFDFSYRDKK